MARGVRVSASVRVRDQEAACRDAACDGVVEGCGAFGGAFVGGVEKEALRGLMLVGGWG